MLAHWRADMHLAVGMRRTKTQRQIMGNHRKIIGLVKMGRNHGEIIAKKQASGHDRKIIVRLFSFALFG